MNKLCIVQCGIQKIWANEPYVGSIEAKKAYTSIYFKKNCAYAKTFGDHWVILSAKYGFLEPNDLIENYNVTFKSKKTGPISIEKLEQQITNQEYMNFGIIIVLGGKEYLEIIKEVFKETSCNVESPFEGLTIGKRMRAINIALNQNKT